MTLGQKGNAKAESVAPERQLATGQKVDEFFFQWAVKPVRVATDGLETDQQPAYQQPRKTHRGHLGAEQPTE